MTGPFGTRCHAPNGQASCWAGTRSAPITRNEPESAAIEVARIEIDDISPQALPQAAARQLFLAGAVLW
jgi:hypothetical protein